MPDTTSSQQPTLLDEVRKVLRLHHYSIHTECSYVEWIVRFVRFHGIRSRADLFPTEPKMDSEVREKALAASRWCEAASNITGVKALGIQIDSRR